MIVISQRCFVFGYDGSYAAVTARFRAVPKLVSDENQDVVTVDIKR